MLSPRTFRVFDCLRSIGVLVAAIGIVGCGGPQATVSGRITCQGRPVSGLVLFSSKSSSEPGSVQESASATLSPNGDYSLKLNGVGKYLVVVTPSDVKLHPKAGIPDYPCDRSPLECDIVAGDNDIPIELSKRSR